MAKESKTTERAPEDSIGQRTKPRRSSHGRPTPAPRLRQKAAPQRQRKPGPGIQPQTVVTAFTFHVNPTLTLVCIPAGTPTLFSLGVAADLTGVHPDMLRYYCRVGLLGVDRTGMLHEPAFDEDALQEVRRIEHYRRHLAVSRRALPLVCELRREAERQHIEIHFLRCP